MATSSSESSKGWTMDGLRPRLWSSVARPRAYSVATARRSAAASSCGRVDAIAVSKARSAASVERSPAVTRSSFRSVAKKCSTDFAVIVRTTSSRANASSFRERAPDRYITKAVRASGGRESKSSDRRMSRRSEDLGLCMGE